jgi:hypothetical protein
MVDLGGYQVAGHVLPARRGSTCSHDGCSPRHGRPTNEALWARSAKQQGPQRTRPADIVNNIIYYMPGPGHPQRLTVGSHCRLVGSILGSLFRTIVRVMLLLLGMQLAPWPAWNVVAPAQRVGACLCWRTCTYEGFGNGSALGHVACLEAPAMHLHARFSVLGQIPSSVAACFSPNWKCSSRSLRRMRMPGLPQLPAPLRWPPVPGVRWWS